MATARGRTDPAVKQRLFEEGYRFDFFEAVRVLEHIYPHRRPVGRNASPADEVARFRAHLSFTFPPSEIHEVRAEHDADEPVEMTVAFMGLTGPKGVLPRHYTELLFERRSRRDRTLRDFFDLFNHRMISLFYRAWEKYRFAVAYERAALKRQEEDRLSGYLFDFIGLGTTGLRGRMTVRDEALLFYAGLLGQQPRSASALAGLLQDYFGVPVEVEQFIGQWLPLALESRTCLGARQSNGALGVSTVAGSHVWEQHAMFQLRLGPLSYAEFCRFLPSGDAFVGLVQLCRFFTRQEDAFELQLLLKADEVPGCRLGGEETGAPRLGWSTWLKSQPFDHDADDAVFLGRLPGSQTLPR